MLLGDQPISNSSQDQLDRADFCRYLARAISEYNITDCIVLGLMGTWGSGKSSILNMVIEFLMKQSRNVKNTKRPIIVKFNPWNYPEKNKILMQFFYNLSLKLKSKRLKKIQKLGEKVMHYGDSFIPFDVTVDSLRKPISFKTRHTDKKSIDYKKDKLTKEFSKLDNRIIIIIDDVDRLEKEEIKQIFQLTKTFGNFPNIIYLIAFDRDIVSRALSDDNMKNGEEYLEKIVQVPFEIPSIPRDKVLSILEYQLEQILSSFRGVKVNQEYWGNIYYGAIQKFFNNIRDIIRYVNSLKISLPFIINEINPIDFIGITCFQVFFPGVYQEIKNNRELLTKTNEELLGDLEKDLKINVGSSLDSIIESVPKKELEHVKTLLCFLFPGLGKIFSRGIYGVETSLKKLQNEKRICIEDYFDTYFRLSVPDNKINKEEIERLVESSSSEVEFASMLKKLNGKGKIPIVIENLRYRMRDIPSKNVRNIINSIIDLADNFKLEEYSNKKYENIIFLCLDLLFKLNDEEERYTVLENAVKSSRSLYFPSLLILKLVRIGKTKEFLIDGFKLLSLEDRMAHKIGKWVKDNNIEKNSNFHNILYNWAKLSNKNQVKKFIDEYIQKREGLISFISSNLVKNYRIKDSKKIPVLEFDMDIDKMLDHIDLSASQLKPRIEELMDPKYFSQLEENEKTALEIFFNKVYQ